MVEFITLYIPPNQEIGLVTVEQKEKKDGLWQVLHLLGDWIQIRCKYEFWPLGGGIELKLNIYRGKNETALPCHV